MSTKNAAKHIRGSLPGGKPTKAALATAVLLGSVFSQGLGGALTAGIDPLASAMLILIGGTTVLFFITAKMYGLSMFSMGTVGTSKTVIFRHRNGGVPVDTVVARWIFVVLTGATSVGINLGISEADGTIGTGPRMAIQACGTLLAGSAAFMAHGEVMQVVMRLLLFGSVALAVDAFGSGELHPGGLLWAAVCALHMFTVTKALTVFDTQKNRDSGMVLANVLALGAMSIWAGLHDGMPTPDKFEGALLPVWVLYLAIPLAVMIIPVLGMNRARGHLSETDQAMLTSTAPIWGAFAAFGLAVFGWAVTPTLNNYQVAGIVMVVLTAFAAARYSAEREELQAGLAQAHAVREQQP